nr:nucleolar protein 16 [Onthophagus taurus]
MPKLRKQRRKQVYRYNVNRKRMRNKQFKTPTIGCKEIKNAWDNKKSIQTNLKEMGLSYDPNVTLGVPNFKKTLKSQIVVEEGDWIEEEIKESVVPSKQYVVEKIIEDAKAPREKLFRLPKGQVEYVTYFMDKYGDDYKAMARDKKNYYQDTWKQIRAKIKRFVSIPEQYGAYLKSKGLSEDEITTKFINTNDDSE